MPPNFMELWRTAQRQFANSDWPAAKQTLMAMLATKPDEPVVLLHLSYVESYLGNYRAARQCALRVHELRPTRDDVVMELLSRLRTFNETGAIMEIVRRLPALDKVSIPMLLTVAAQMSYLNLQERALPYLDEAFKGDPDYPPTLLARAQVLIYSGRFPEAIADLERCRKRAPELPSVYWHLSRVKKSTAEHNHVETLRRLLRLRGNEPEHDALCGYALHYELNDIGDYEAAWDALELACRSKRAMVNYSTGATKVLVDALVSMPRPGPASGNAPSSAGTARIPIFIVGMHRSGTTLLEQLLDGHDRVKGVGELYDFTSQMRYATDHHCRGVIDATIVERSATVDFHEVGRGYLERMEWRLGKEPCFTDKLPSNFLNIDFICRSLPQARILHMVRDPVETCFSNLRELFSDANPYSYDQLELAEYHNQYRRLMAHWHERWPGRVLDVDYAELTRDPEVVLRRVCGFCELDFQPRMLDFPERERGVATASAVQVRQGIVARKSPKWAPYARHLQPLIEALGNDGASDPGQTDPGAKSGGNVDGR